MSSTVYQQPPILVYGHPGLRGVAKLVPNNYSPLALKAHVDAMYSALAASGGDAISANQIGLDLRIFVMNRGLVPAELWHGNFPYVVFINPSIVSTSGVTRLVNNDGCLSIPSLQLPAPPPDDPYKYWTTRYTEVTIAFQSMDYTSGVLETTTTTFAVTDQNVARVVQHELDHLQGEFFTDQFGRDFADTYMSGYKSGTYQYSASYPTLPYTKY